MTKAQLFVLKEFPSAYYEPKTREVCLYSAGFVLGRGSVLARSIENDAWREAASQIKRRGWATEA